MSAPVIFSGGAHWHPHGDAVPLLARSGSAKPSCGDLSVYSGRHPKQVGGDAHVLLEGTTDPFTLAARMTPEAARALSRSLAAAADMADAVTERLSTKGGA